MPKVKKYKSAVTFVMYIIISQPSNNNTTRETLIHSYCYNQLWISDGTDDMFLVDATLCFLREFSGFKESSKGCCGTGLIEVALLCNILSKTCTNASEYVFWDSSHPTQRAYEIIVEDIIVEVMADLN
jgi:GDSL-like Lipase/Acylhydrolase